MLTVAWSILSSTYHTAIVLGTLALVGVLLVVKWALQFFHWAFLEGRS
jgi:hypothetical protein